MRIVTAEEWKSAKKMDYAGIGKDGVKRMLFWVPGKGTASIPVTVQRAKRKGKGS